MVDLALKLLFVVENLFVSSLIHLLIFKSDGSDIVLMLRILVQVVYPVEGLLSFVKINQNLRYSKL